MNWRTWVYDQLTSEPALTGKVPKKSVYSTLSLDKPPEKKPFIVLVFGNENPELKGTVSQQTLAVWVHDEGASYLRIDEILSIVRGILMKPQVKEPGAFMCEWEGDSGDLSDDAMRTILRTSSYRVTTRKEG